MVRTLCMLSAGGTLALFMTDGRVGGIDLMHLPPALIAFVAASALIIIGLRLI